MLGIFRFVVFRFSLCQIDLDVNPSRTGASNFGDKLLRRKAFFSVPNGLMLVLVVSST